MAEEILRTETSATPLWFGPDDRPLFGWLHLPAGGTARAGVVLCQPLGIEAICVYFTYRQLADRLTERGLAVLRFDYDGTGDSVGTETDPDRVAAWTSSTGAAADYLAAIGVGHIGMVGIRMGALLAALEAQRRGGVEALVLWDPCLSGRTYLREQRFLHTVATGPKHLDEMEGEGGEGGEGDTNDGAVEAPGIRFEAATVKELSDLDLLSTSGSLTRRALVLTPPGRSRPRRLAQRLEGAAVDWQVATGEDELLDSQLQDTPWSTIEAVAEWLVGALEGPAVTVSLPKNGSSVIGRSAWGQPIVERSLALGSHGLFGILTEGAHRPDEPTVVLVNEGNTHHIGQSRIWVDLSRHLATFGFRVLRFDLSGNGDSTARPRQQPHVARSPESDADVLAAARAVCPEDPSNVVLVGFCSGGYQIAEFSLSHPVRGICVINPSFCFVPPEPVGSWKRPARQSTRRWFVKLAQTPAAWASERLGPNEQERWLNALDIGTWPVAFAARHRSIPEPVWWLVNRLLLEQTAAATLERIVAKGVDTLLVCGPDDLTPITLGSEARVRRVRQSDNFHVVVLDDLDHSSWPFYQRLRMIDVLTEHLLDRHRGPRPEPSVTPIIGNSI